MTEKKHKENDREWSNEECQYVNDNFGKLPLRDMAKHLGRSGPSIKAKYRRMNNIYEDTHIISGAELTSRKWLRMKM